jgi:hypothetical protein
MRASASSLEKMAGGIKRNLHRLPKSKLNGEPEPDDVLATWSRERLAEMDSAFVKAVARAFRAGQESEQAAAATVAERRR